MTFTRYTKYEVMKLDDIEKYCSLAQREYLKYIIRTIQDGREEESKVPCNKYVVVNEDQPYAGIVWKLIEFAETHTARDLERLIEGLDMEFY